MAIDGLVSGLDTTSILKSMMAIERAPQDALVARQNKVKAGLDALNSIKTKLTAASTAASELATMAKWGLVKGSSSNSATATVVAASGASPTALSFTVDQLAASHSLRSGDVIASMDTVVATSGTISIDTGNGPVSVDVGSGTLREVISAVGASGLGLSANAVNTGAGFRLQVSAKNTGVGSTFTLDGLDAAGGTVITSAGRDAQLTIGDGPGAYSVVSSSNTFSEIMPGISVTAVSVSPTPVTVTIAADVEGLASKVKALVDAANSALSEIASKTAYNPQTKVAGVLNGDATVRRAAQDLTRSVAEAVTGSSLGSVGLAGVQLGRNGQFSFDPVAFTAAYGKDPDAVTKLFAQSSTDTGSVSFVSTGSRTVDGTYDIDITQAAERASSLGLAGAWPMAVDTTVSVKVGSTTVDWTIAAGTTLGDAAIGLRGALSASGLRLEVSEEAGGLSLSSIDYGSGAKFDVAWDGATWESQQGVDVAGTIGGIAAIGNGQMLAVALRDSTLGGMVVKTTGTATGLIGTVSFNSGAAQRVGSTVANAIDSTDGYLTGSETSRKARVDDLAKSISAYDVRLALRETRLRAYWSALEVSLGNLKQQSSWLSGQIAGLATS
ncbi:MAG TPA: flagellar filament capping protein FliD [Microthrixaceae bacterium]|nr:flagellar filament capping protein FliD [Microthrixaceae bacterium]